MQGSVDTSGSLSLILRDQTKEHHDAVEQAIGLPHTIMTRTDYLSCLRRFHQLYCPLSQHLRSFAEWPAFGIDPATLDYDTRLAADLARLEPARSLPADAPPQACPDLPIFPHALGALYVLQGSGLGGAVILRHLQTTGIETAENSAFFGSHGMKLGPAWQKLRATLDCYGRDHPFHQPHVLAGTKRTFAAVREWMQREHWN